MEDEFRRSRENAREKNRSFRCNRSTVANVIIRSSKICSIFVIAILCGCDMKSDRNGGNGSNGDNSPAQVALSDQGLWREGERSSLLERVSREFAANRDSQDVMVKIVEKLEEDRKIELKVEIRTNEGARNVSYSAHEGAAPAFFRIRDEYLEAVAENRLKHFGRLEIAKADIYDIGTGSFESNILFDDKDMFCDYIGVYKEPRLLICRWAVGNTLFVAKGPPAVAAPMLENRAIISDLAQRAF